MLAARQDSLGAAPPGADLPGKGQNTKRWAEKRRERSTSFLPSLVGGGAMREPGLGQMRSEDRGPHIPGRYGGFQAQELDLTG